MLGILKYIVGWKGANGGIIIDAASVFKEACLAKQAGLARATDGRWFVTPEGLQLLDREREGNCSQCLVAQAMNGEKTCERCAL